MIKGTFLLREATREDCDLLFEWANDPIVRENSFCKHSIGYEEHVKWFCCILNNKEQKLYILEKEGCPIGQVRVRSIDNTATISYSISPTNRGNGYGKLMIELLKRRMVQEYPNIKTLVAEVKKDNIASKKVFKGNGFKEKCTVYELDLY